MFSFSSGDGGREGSEIVLLSKSIHSSNDTVTVESSIISQIIDLGWGIGGTAGLKTFNRVIEEMSMMSKYIGVGVGERWILNLSPVNHHLTLVVIQW